MAKAPTGIASVTTDLFKLLEPLEPDLRKRAIKAALTMLGDDPAVADAKPKGGGAAGDTGEDTSEFNTKTRTWMRQNNVTNEQTIQRRCRAPSVRTAWLLRHQQSFSNNKQETRKRFYG